MKRHVPIYMSISVAAGLILAGGIAYAAIPDSGGTIHACYKTTVPAHGTPLSIIDSEAGGTCPNGYTELTWSSVKDTLVTQRVVSDTVTVNPGADGSAAAVCPDGWRLTGGGFAEAGGSPTIIGSYAVLPVRGQIWEVDVHNSTSDEAGIAAVAECAQLQ